MTDQTIADKRFQIMSVFRPSAPISNADLFAGRIFELQKLVDAVAEVGRHAILYGERGVGKSSLINILGVTINKQVPVSSVTCGRKDTFTDIWDRALRQIVVTKTSSPVGFAEQDPILRERSTFADSFRDSRISPDDVRLIFQQRNARVVITIDEVDKVEDADVRGQLADTIKTLSDHASPATLILVGVADSVTDLVHDHQSIGRALQQVPMKRMEKGELREALHKCLSLLGMDIDKQGEDVVVTLSSGLPHYTHLLGQHAALIANKSERVHITHEDVTQAIDRAVENAQQTILRAYIDATQPYRKESIHKKLLLACALAETDELGQFRATEIKQELSEIAGIQYEVAQFASILSQFIGDKRGHILQRTGGRNHYKYRFQDPLLQPYVIMRGIQDKLIRYDKVKRMMAQ